MAAKKNDESTKKTAGKRSASTKPIVKANAAKGASTKGKTSTPKKVEPTKKKATRSGKTSNTEVESVVSTTSKTRAKGAMTRLKPTSGKTRAMPQEQQGLAKTRTAKSRASVSPSSDGRVLIVGDTVPEFEALDQDGELVKSSSLAGAPYVLYFYPKDDTPGCTTEACGFRDEHAVFTQRGIRILGVSPDSPASHTRFRQKYGLGFTLLADTERKLVTQFGVWKLKQNYGREYWGVERSTFIVDGQGKIAQAWRGVKVAGHIPAVLDAASKL